MRRVLLCALVMAFALGGTSFGAAQGNWDPVTGPAGAWVYVVFSPYDAMVPRLESAAQHFGPEAISGLKEFPNEIKKELGEQLGIEADMVDLTRPIGVVVFNPTAGEGPVATIVPVKAGGTLPEGVKLADGFAVASDSETLATRIRGLIEGAGSSAIAPPQGMARLYIDLGTIIQIFGPLVQMQASMAMSQAPGANAQAGVAAMDIFFSILGQIENVVLDVDVVGNNVQAIANVKAKAGTDIAQLCANQTVGTALGSLVGAGSLAVSGKLVGFPGWAMRLTEQALGKMIADPKEADTLKASIAKFMGNMGDEFAVAYRFTPQGIEADMALAYSGTIGDVRDYFKSMLSDKAPDTMRKLMGAGGDVKFEYKENVRQVAGVAVDRFSVDMSKLEGLEPQVKKQIEAMWGKEGAAGEYALVGNRWVMSMGGKDGAARLDQLIAKVKSPLAGVAEKAPLTFSVDLLQIAAWGMQAAGMEAPAELTQGGAPITGNVTFSGRTVTKRLTVPLDSVAKVVKVAESAASRPDAPVESAPVEMDGEKPGEEGEGAEEKAEESHESPEKAEEADEGEEEK